MAAEKKTKKVNDLESIKSNFITVASHQLRTPISAVRWSLDTLLNGKVGQLSPKQKEIAQEAYQNNKFMVKVVNDLLRVARLEEKGLELNPNFTDIIQIINRSIKKHGDLARATNCAITLKTDPGLPKAYVDKAHIELVIDAIINNAIFYGGPKGNIKISLKKINDYLLVKIQDAGIGIPRDQQNMVFSKFFRGGNAMKAQTEGLGLDLYVSKKIISASGGKITFLSKENKGSTFNIYLPLSKEKSGGKTSAKIESEPEKEKIGDGDNDILKKEREFVSITVHELKAPLGISKWSLEMLKSKKPGQLTKDQMELIDQIYGGNERLLVLVRDLLNLSKLQEGKFEIEPKKISLEKITGDVIKGFKNQAGQKKIKFAWNPGAEKMPPVYADPNRVAQIITNLVSNAIKYTPENGKVGVTIAKKTGQELKKLNGRLSTADIYYTKNKPGYLVLAVKDTGIGISAEDQKKLFTRFFRSKKVLKSQAEGTGLGLYITKSIINLHQGDIWFTSKLNNGSSFYFSLPIA
ncbi:HAMP domain-containing histidine kinase [Candidatus Falkowbacteria bacterium]|nr:HAMP domain-containing histidine kinase [Candidatus Falkowbacteria bacterium]